MGVVGVLGRVSGVVGVVSGVEGEASMGDVVWVEGAVDASGKRSSQGPCKVVGVARLGVDSLKSRAAANASSASILSRPVSWAAANASSASILSRPVR